LSIGLGQWKSLKQLLHLKRTRESVAQEEGGSGKKKPKLSLDEKRAKAADKEQVCSLLGSAIHSLMRGVLGRGCSVRRRKRSNQQGQRSQWAS
jgi:hypothetical protein